MTASRNFLGAEENRDQMLRTPALIPVLAFPQTGPTPSMSIKGRGALFLVNSCQRFVGPRQVIPRFSRESGRHTDHIRGLTARKLI
jgi:hypothetical protein